jgi:hypothetical protein
LLRADPNVTLSRRRDQAQRANARLNCDKRGKTGESSRLSRLGQESRKSFAGAPKARPHRADRRDRQDNLDDICGTGLHIPEGDFATLSPAGFSATSALASSRRSERPSRCSNRETVTDLQHHRMRQMPLLLPKTHVSSLQRTAGGFSATGSTGPRPSSFAFPARRRASIPFAPAPMKKRS